MVAPRAAWLLPAAALLFGDVVHAKAHQDYYSERDPCPVSCSSTTDTSQWTLYSSLGRLTYCHEPVLFEISLSGENPFKRSQLTRVMACTAGDSTDAVDTIIEAVEEDNGGVSDGLARRDLSCPAVAQETVSAELASLGTKSSASSRVSVDLLKEIRQWAEKSSRCSDRTTITLGHYNGTVAGYLAGGRVDGKSAAKGLVDAAISDISDNGIGETLTLQHCNLKDEEDPDVTGGAVAGVIIDTKGGFLAVQRALRSWNKGECTTEADAVKESAEIQIGLYPPEISQTINSLRTLQKRQSGECKWIRAEEGDTCTTLAKRCGISGAKYMTYNSDQYHCSSLREGLPVCCSEGKQPDLRPDQNADGSCFWTRTRGGDTCDGIRAKNGLSEKELFSFNEDTWGWSGCDPLPVGIRICLSKGKPPLPESVDNAMCGPTKPGSSAPKGDQKLTDLNPCPLKVCCNIWGMCGTTEDFCTISKSETGAPGTSAPGEHGCIQNCGMEIINNSKKPEKFYKLGYFEGWNKERPCLHMDVGRTKKHKQDYTDVHFSFGHITDDGNYDVLLPDNVKSQWEKFLKIQDGPRKTLALGGWAFSAEQPHYKLFREATKPANQRKFAENCVKFAVDNKLDGLDFDWEYPGAPDIPGIPPGGEDEGENYLSFLKTVRGLLPKDMTLSIAAPASFWYLKQFPIADMHQYLDYIVYMTYDLHGQWDDENPWSNPGCEQGNCLRSHVNWTETYNALAMVTKAGVPAHKILMGVATYGRSFKMTQPGCWGEMCTFIGGESPAKKGRCTDTGGYLSNAEIFEIAASESRVTRKWTDTKTRANYLVYDNVEWVSYMDSPQRQWRELQASRLNFGGTIEWAIDLAEFFDDDEDDDGDDDDDDDEQTDKEMSDIPFKSRDLWDMPDECEDTSPYKDFDDLEKAGTHISGYCRMLYMLQHFAERSHAAIERYKELESESYDEFFSYYHKAMRDLTPDMMAEWRKTNGSEYFTCTVEARIRCCKDCGKYMVMCNKFCAEPDDEENGDICDKPSTTVRERFVDLPCPGETEWDTFKKYNATWTVRKDKEDEMYESIAKYVGVDKDNVDFRTTTFYSAGGIPDPNEHIDPDADYCPGPNSQMYCIRARQEGVPSVKFLFGTEEGDIVDPKDIIEEGLKGADDLTAAFRGFEVAFRAGQWTADWEEVIDGLQLPLFMLEEGVANMEKVYELGEDLKEQETKNMIFLFLEVALMFVPFAGAFLRSAATNARFIANVRAALNWSSDAGFLAIDSYKLSEAIAEGDEEAIAGLAIGMGLTSLGSLSNFGDLRKAARLSRELDAEYTELIRKHVEQSQSMTSSMKSSCPIRYA